MELLLNFLFAVLAFIVTSFVLARARVQDPINVVVAVIVAIIVFLANFAATVVD